MEKTIKLGISACLLGQKVRFDGQHKWDYFLTDTLGQYVEYLAVCPEVECGFGVPREPFHLVGNPDSPRLITIRSKQDHTEHMITWAQKRVVELEHEELCGFIFKSKSPSSGMRQVKVYNEKGGSVKKGVGLFARTFMEHFPLLPTEDEGRLHDPKIRENFIEQIFTVKRWQESTKQGKSRAHLIDFHTTHKMLILSHSPKHQRMMGKLLAQIPDTPVNDFYEQYQALLMESLRLKATVKKHVNVLHHLMGYFKKQLSTDEKQELLEIIDLYHQEHIPLIVPIILINHYTRKYRQPYLAQQYYLHPHPVELHLRNHV